MLLPHNTGSFLWIEELGFTEDFLMSIFCGLKYYCFILFFYTKENVGKQPAKIVKTVRILISSTYQDVEIDFEYRNAVHL